MAEAYREFGHLRAHLDPLGLIRPAEPFSLAAFGLSEADLGRPTADPEGRGDRTAARPAGPARRDLLPLASASSWPTSTTWSCGRWLRAADGADPQPADARARGAPAAPRQDHRAPRCWSSSCRTSSSAPSASALEGAESLMPLLELLIDRAARPTASATWSSAWPTAGGSTCSPTCCGSRRPSIFARVPGHGRSIDARRRRREVPPRLLGRPRRPRRRRCPVHVSLAFNPSHLEWVDTVVQGRVRAKQDRYGDFERLADHAAADPRRRRLRRAGDRGRVAQHVGAGRLPRGRHDPRDRQQPGRVHHLAPATRAPPPTAPTSPACCRSRSST